MGLSTSVIDYDTPPPGEKGRTVWWSILSEKLPVMLSDVEHHGQWGVVWHNPDLKTGQSGHGHVATLKDFAALFGDDRFAFKAGAHPRGGAAVWAKVIPENLAPKN